MRRRLSAVSPAAVALVIAVAMLSNAPMVAAGSPRLSLLTGSAAPLPAGDTVIGAAPSSTNLSLNVALAPRDSAALAAAVNAVSTSGSPQYRQFLAPGQFAQRYGPTPQVVASVTAALQSEGLSVGPVSATGLSLPVTGAVAQVDAAFDTTISEVREASGAIGYYNERAPSVASTIASDVQGIVGLDTLVQPQATLSGPLTALHPAGARVTHPRDDTQSPQTSQPTPTSSCGSTFTQLENDDGSHIASQFAQSYNLDPLYAMGAYGAGTTVALAEFGAANYVPSDITTFANCYGISSYQLSEVGDTSLGAGANSDETELDVETVLSLAPAASIEVYQAGTTYDGSGYYDLFNKIVGDDSAKIVSVSYGTCEADEPTSWMNEENTVLQAAALEGQTFFASSGDTGSEACNGGGPNGVDTGDEPLAQAVDSSTGTLYVANENDDNVSVIDENTGDLVATVSTGFTPKAIVVDGATAQVFVANTGSNSLTEFSATTCQASNVSGCSSPTTMTGSQFNQPSSLFISGPTLYVGNGGNYTVSVNTLSGSNVATVHLQPSDYPSAVDVDTAGEVYVDAGASLYYVGNCNSTTTSGCSTLGQLHIGDSHSGMLFDPANNDLYVANVFDPTTSSIGSIEVVNTSTNTETQYIDDGNLSTSSLALSPSGDLLADSSVDGTLFSISTSTGDILAAVPLQTGNDFMTQIAVDPVLNYVWILDYTSKVDLVEELSLGVNDPASQPDVTGVGGTSLSSGEVAWGDGGGGVSQVFDMPSYQTSLGVIAGSSGTPCGNSSGDCREVPDVAADADPNTGESIYDADQGGWAEFGGTSLAAPIWAAALADISAADSNTAGFGLLNPSLYSLAHASPGTYLNDVTAGENDETGTNGGDYGAGSGYDMATGLGAPNAYTLFVGLKGGHALVNVSLSANTRQPNQDASWLFSATTSSTGALAASSGTIRIVAPSGSEFLPGAQVHVDSTVATTVSGTGTTTLTVTTPIAIADATTFSVNIVGMNPSAGNYASAFTLSTSSDTTTTHLTQGFGIGAGVINVAFAASIQTAGATSTWTVQATTSASGALTAGSDWLVINAPSGTVFSTSNSAYSVNGVPVAPNDASGADDNQVTIVTPVNVGNSSSITVVMSGVTNPSGNYSATSDFSVSTIADASNYARPGLNFGTPTTSVSNVTIATSTLQGAATSVWTVQGTTSATGALAAANGTITITAPSGTTFPTGNGNYVVNGALGIAPTVSGGHIVSVTTANAIGDSTTFTIVIGQVTNPPVSAYPASAFSVATSSDGTATNPSNGLTFVTSSVPGAPTSPAISAGTDSATLSWTAPSSGGSPITGYSVTLNNYTSNTQTMNACPGSTSSSTTQCTVNSLTGGDSYYFTVTAINAVGNGPTSLNSPIVLISSSSGGGGSGGGGGGGTGGSGSAPPSGGRTTPPTSGGGTGGDSGSLGGTSTGVKPTVDAVTGSLQVGSSSDLILSGSGFRAGAKVVSNARGLRFTVRSVGASRVTLTVLTSTSVKSGTYHLTITNKDGRGDSVLVVLVVNKHTGTVVVHVKP